MFVVGKKYVTAAEPQIIYEVVYKGEAKVMLRWKAGDRQYEASWPIHNYLNFTECVPLPPPRPGFKVGDVCLWRRQHRKVRIVSVEDKGFVVFDGTYAWFVLDQHCGGLTKCL